MGSWSRKRKRSIHCRLLYNSFTYMTNKGSVEKGGGIQVRKDTQEQIIVEDRKGQLTVLTNITACRWPCSVSGTPIGAGRGRRGSQGRESWCMWSPYLRRWRDNFSLIPGLLLRGVRKRRQQWLWHRGERRWRTVHLFNRARDLLNYPQNFGIATYRSLKSHP